jgi:hypothetical protein
LVGVLLIVIMLSGCSQPEDNDGASSQQGVDGTLKGVSLSPRSMDGTDFTEFLERVNDTQDALMWAGDWMQLSEGGAPVTIFGLSEEYDYIPIIEVGHYTQETGDLLRPFNETNQQYYINSTLDFVSEYRPAYFGMGVEINVFAEKNPTAFEDFVPFYNELYDQIKEISPQTKVFTVFQLEKMKGLTMWEIEPSEPHWKLIDRFKMDIVAFTTYPGLFYRNVEDIPVDHYLEILEHTSKPIAFTEIGWHSDPAPAGWESSQEEQADFVHRLFDLTDELELEIAVWSFMYDLEVLQPFDSMGLIDRAGNEKLSWEVWNRQE